MIYIWDNGESYSDHHIEFIDTKGFDPEDVKLLVSRHRGMERVIAIVESVEWRDQGALTPVVDLPSLIVYANHPDEFLGPLSFETIDKLLQHWRDQVVKEIRRLRAGPNTERPQPKIGRARARQYLATWKWRLNAVKAFLATKTPKCEKCGGPGSEPHTCPYQSDVNNDHESLCTCCAACEHECLMDI